MLGGFDVLQEPDVIDSNLLLKELEEQRILISFSNVADVGGGIGRVVKHVLLKRFDKVDLVEPSPRLLASAPSYLATNDCSLEEEEEGDEEKVGCDKSSTSWDKDEINSKVTFTNQGLQDWSPIEGTYDLIWAQWSIVYLHDADLISFLQRCKQALKEGGVVVIKENTTDEDMGFMVDKDDASLIRSPAYFNTLFSIAGFTTIIEKSQLGFPSELYTVKMFVLKNL